jgi:hypothetical protein
MTAITSYYLPDCLYDSGVRGIDLQRAVVDAIAQLEVQILKLKHNYGMGQFPQVVVVNPIGGVTASGMLSHSSQAVGANIYPNPAVSFFGENEASTTVEVSQDKQSELVVPTVLKKEEFSQEEDLDDDGFFDSDEDDLIAKAQIEVDPGFRLE